MHQWSANRETDGLIDHFVREPLDYNVNLPPSPKAWLTSWPNDQLPMNQPTQILTEELLKGQGHLVDRLAKQPLINNNSQRELSCQDSTQWRMSSKGRSDTIGRWRQMQRQKLKCPPNSEKTKGFSWLGWKEPDIADAQSCIKKLWDSNPVSRCGFSCDDWIKLTNEWIQLWPLFNIYLTLFLYPHHEHSRLIHSAKVIDVGS